jgi:hypothetical protein
MGVLTLGEDLLWLRRSSTGLTTHNKTVVGSMNISTWLRRQEQVTIITELRGEMGNQLSTIAFGYGLKWLLEDDYSIDGRVVLRHQNHPKWVKSRESVVKCFPNLRHLEFSEGNTPEFDERLEQQKQWLGEHIHNHLHFETFLQVCELEHCYREAIDKLKNVLLNSSGAPPLIPKIANISMPFFYSEGAFAYNGYTIDRFYERLKELFHFDYDNPSCCTEAARINETVIHFRGFVGEMSSDRMMSLGFEELSPNKTANELLSHLQAGDEVALVSRFPEKSSSHIEAMRGRGLNVRLVDGLNGEQSFCFLLSAKKEMIGFSRSTFAMWAAYLTNATKARIYSLKSPERVQRLGSKYFITANFTNPLLNKTPLFELYNSEAQDQIDNVITAGRRTLLYPRDPAPPKFYHSGDDASL